MLNVATKLYDHLKTLVVLVVEDEELMRNNLAMILKRKVKEVIVAENGKDGLEKYLESRPDIVITDLAMPVMDGSEMTRQIRENNPESCVIVVTAYSEDQHPCEGASHRLMKPLMKDRLLEAMTDCMNHK
jgi:YesN/AraC family two-component response regulator